MIEAVCLKLKDYSDESYICNEKYINTARLKNNIKYAVRYEVIKDKIINCMEDLIKYCLIYNYDIDIPKNYKVDKIYNILFTTGNFDPDSRSTSNCHSSIVFSSLDEKYIYSKFKIMCKSINRKSLYESKRTYCWHTEDFADNQIIHSYDIDESYIVTKLGVE